MPSIGDRKLGRFRFLGLRWRFLNQDIENESFPSIKKLKFEDIKLDVNQESDNIAELLRDLKDPDHCEDDIVSPRIAAILEQIDTEIREENVSDIKLKNAIMFDKKDASRAMDKPEELMSMASPRINEIMGIVHAKPPTISKPSFGNEDRPTKRSILKNYENPSVAVINSKKNNDRKTRKKKEEVSDMDISKNFKMYALEKGLRVPNLVLGADVPESSRSNLRPLHSMEGGQRALHSQLSGFSGSSKSDLGAPNNDDNKKGSFGPSHIFK